MVFWPWFRQQQRAKRKTPAKSARRTVRTKLDPAVARALSRLRREIRALKSDITDINTQLKQHGTALSDNSHLIREQARRLGKLEELALTPPSGCPLVSSRLEEGFPPPHPASDRVLKSANRLITDRQEPLSSAAQIGIQPLSVQEQKILQVFLSHRDMALSYLDLARALGKSPHTIKNQLRQLNLKVSLLDKTIGAHHENRFRLKKHLQINPQPDSGPAPE